MEFIQSGARDGSRFASVHEQTHYDTLVSLLLENQSEVLTVLVLLVVLTAIWLMLRSLNRWLLSKRHRPVREIDLPEAAINNSISEALLRARVQRARREQGLQSGLRRRGARADPA